MRSRHEKVRRENFGNHCAGDRQRCAARARAASRVLQPRVGHGGQHDMAMPPDKRATLEMIEAELVLQFFVLLLYGVMSNNSIGLHRLGPATASTREVV